jgi:hypothetical protein
LRCCRHRRFLGWDTGSGVVERGIDGLAPEAEIRRKTAIPVRIGARAPSEVIVAGLLPRGQVFGLHGRTAGIRLRSQIMPGRAVSCSGSDPMGGRASVRAGVTAGLGRSRLGRSLALPTKMKLPWSFSSRLQAVDRDRI